MAGPRRPPPTPGLKPAEFRAQTNDLLEKANTHLSNREPYAALQIYTTLITKIAPAHPIVFLNRALAYLALDFPELAIADAYKAKTAIQEIRDRLFEGYRSPSLQALVSYAKVCERAADSGADWATEPTCYLRGALMDVEAASIVLDVSNLRKAEKHEKAYIMLWDLETKANYRLALGLWKVGGGARMDALDILTRGRRMLHETSEDRESYDDLGNAILEDFNREFYAEDKMAKDMGIKGKDEKEAFQMAGARGQNYHGQALIKRQLCPENTFEPDLEGKGVPQSLINGISKITTNAHLQIIKSPTGKLAQLALVATRDISPGEIVLEERSSLYVTTTSLDSATNPYCDTCATMMLGSPSRRSLVRSQTVFPIKRFFPDESPTEPNTSVASSPIPDTISEPDKDDPVILSQDVSRKPSPPLSPPSSGTVSGKGPSPPSANRPSAPTPSSNNRTPNNPHLCPTCNQTLYCSQHCLTFATTEYHTPLCRTSIEDTIRHSALHGAAKKRTIPGLADSKGWTEPEEQCLRQLLLARILAIAVRMGRHPLEVDEVRFLGGGEFKVRDLSPLVNYGSDEDEEMDSLSNTCNSDLSSSVAGSGSNRRNGKVAARIAEEEKTMPWSYISNIELPHRILSQMNANPLKDSRRFDGWVINTLMAKIQHSMLITRGARCVKVFGDATAEVRVDGMKKGLKDDKDGGEEEEVWVGSLHPVLSLVRKEGEDGVGMEKGKGNVIIEEMGMGIVRCIAVSNSHDSEHETSFPAFSFDDVDEMDITHTNNNDSRGGVEQSFQAAHTAPRPAIQKGELIILKALTEDDDDKEPTILANDTHSPTNGKSNGVQSWLNSVEATPTNGRSVKILDGSGKPEEQSFYDGVIGARDGARGGGVGIGIEGMRDVDMEMG